MKNLPYVTVAEIVSRLEKRYWATGGHPIGLHCWPKTEHADKAHWFGIGPVNWGIDDDLPAFFDIRIQDIDYGYAAVNRMVREACKELDLEYINMA